MFWKNIDVNFLLIRDLGRKDLFRFYRFTRAFGKNIYIIYIAEGPGLKRQSGKTLPFYLPRKCLRNPVMCLFPQKPHLRVAEVPCRRALSRIGTSPGGSVFWRHQRSLLTMWRRWPRVLFLIFWCFTGFRPPKRGEVIAAADDALSILHGVGVKGWTQCILLQCLLLLNPCKAFASSVIYLEHNYVTYIDNSYPCRALVARPGRRNSEGFGFVKAGPREL